MIPGPSGAQNWARSNAAKPCGKRSGKDGKLNMSPAGAV